ncbi:type II secretion system protein [Microlunatus elymi]|uniref:Type II secretion system protein n=1 Tax=Microlunatus elymi TaxID=2596828 RepID=A0A516PVE0_9ACTN|nr:type II secretion system protein [Microlunatus elymi]QDP95120.1 type II secretion system protein [Microlunatus elymi]
MTGIAVLLAGFTAWLLIGPAPARTMRQRLAPVSEQLGKATSSRSALDLTPFLVLLSGPVLAAVLFGVQGFWLSLPAVIIAGTVVITTRRALRRRRAAARRREVAQACSVLAAQVRVGQVPLAALRSAADDCAILRPAVAAADLGGDVAAGWRAQAAEPGQAGLADLARAWSLSISSGAGMAQALDDVAEGLAEDESLGLVINSEAAAPRASGKVMAVLPLVGIGLGYLIGGDPMGFLTGSPWGWACLIGGSIFVAAGVLWMEGVADHAAVGG